MRFAGQNRITISPDFSGRAERDAFNVAFSRAIFETRPRCVKLRENPSFPPSLRNVSHYIYI